MHLFLTGKPSSGKTTLIRAILENIPIKRGFFTEEIREKGKRVGFKITTLGGKEAIFAHKDFKSRHKVSCYGVDVNMFNSVAVNELKQALDSQEDFVVVDELGKMELFSDDFKAVVLNLIEKKRILGTLSLTRDPFLEKIRNRRDVCILNLDKRNFEEVKNEVRLILKSISVDEARYLDKRAQELGMEERLLIENASSNLCEIIDRLNMGRNALVIAGRGNNGADVLSCARKLRCRDYMVKVAIIKEKELGQEAAFQKGLLEKINVPIFYFNEVNIYDLTPILAEVDFIVDGILGIGVRGEVSPVLKKVITIINKSGKRIVSCDTPSGLSPDDGVILGEAVRAEFTVTFIAPKQGFFVNRGRQCCGKIIVSDIGVPREVLESPD